VRSREVYAELKPRLQTLPFLGIIFPLADTAGKSLTSSAAFSFSSVLKITLTADLTEQTISSGSASDSSVLSCKFDP
jgi:hypothetical protein